MEQKVQCYNGRFATHYNLRQWLRFLFYNQRRELNLYPNNHQCNLQNPLPDSLLAIDLSPLIIEFLVLD